MNKTRSSRDLEKSCKRNIEVMWLIGSLQPDHLPSRSKLRFGKAGNTISNFRRDNPKAIRKVFRATEEFAKHLKDIVFLYIAEICSTIRKYKLFKAFSFFRNIEVNSSLSTKKGLIFAGN